MLDVELLVNTSDNELLGKRLGELVEKIKYSDPMSDDSLISIENEIEGSVAKISEAIKDDDIDLAMKKCNELHILLEERNQKCKLLQK